MFQGLCSRSVVFIALLSSSHITKDVSCTLLEPNHHRHVATTSLARSRLAALRGGEGDSFIPPAWACMQVFREDVEMLERLQQGQRQEVGFCDNWILNFKSKQNISTDGLNIETRRVFRRQLKNDSLVTELQDFLCSMQDQGITEDDAADVCKVFNFPAPKSRKSYDWDNAIDCRMRLIISYLRQRQIKKKNGELVRLDRIFEDLFNLMEQSLNLRDGFVTVYSPHTVPGKGAEPLKPPFKAKMKIQEVAGLGETLVMQDKKPSNIHMSPHLIPIQCSPLASVHKKDYLLWSAIDQGALQLVQRSLNEGANASSIDWRFGVCMPIHRAVLQGSREVVELLVGEGVDIHVRTSDSATPLHLAARAGNVDVAKLLVKLGAEVNSVDDSFNTPLHKAAEGGHVEMARELVLLGADLFLRNSWFATPSEVAESLSKSFKRSSDGNQTEAAQKRRNHEIIANLLRPQPLLGDEDDEPKTFGRRFLTTSNGSVVYVGNIDWSTTREQLESHFSKSCPGLEEVVFSAPNKLPSSDSTAGHKPQHGGRAWLVFKDEVSAKRALRMRGTVLNQRKLWVQLHSFTDSRAPGKSPVKRSLSV